MQMHGKRPEQSSQSFLPEDYLQQRADRRMGFITLVLFCVIMFGVVGAFFWTNREWKEVRAAQQRVNLEYTTEAQKIEQLKVLEAQKAEMLDKAEITTALIEKVPRSILLAELINRMPSQLTLSEFKLTSKRIKEAPAPAARDAKPKSLAIGKPIVAAQNAAPERPKPVPPRYEFRVELIGLAATDNEVADYHSALQECELLADVELLFSGHVIIDDVGMRKFRIEASIREDADARHIEPLQKPRLAALPSAHTTTIEGKDEEPEIANAAPRQE